MKKAKILLETADITKIISNEVNFERGFKISLLNCADGYNLFLNNERMGTLSVDKVGPFAKCLTELLESFNIKYTFTQK
jgi:hypothetical protein